MIRKVGQGAPCPYPVHAFILTEWTSLDVLTADVHKVIVFDLIGAFSVAQSDDD